MPRISSKGQVTIPKRLRDSLDLREGDRVVFDLMDDGIVLRKRARASLLDMGGVAGGKRPGGGRRKAG